MNVNIVYIVSITYKKNFMRERKFCTPSGYYGENNNLFTSVSIQTLHLNQLSSKQASFMNFAVLQRSCIENPEHLPVTLVWPLGQQVIGWHWGQFSKVNFEHFCKWQRVTSTEIQMLLWKGTLQYNMALCLIILARCLHYKKKIA